MPGYVNNVLNKFQHENPKTPQHTTSKYVTPVYSLFTKQFTTIQKITGSVLYYSRAVNHTLFMPINDISTEQTTAKEKNTNINKSAFGLSDDSP
jgi:hypothetical protein